MTLAWRWMIGWWGIVGLAFVVLLAGSFHRVFTKICRPKNKPRSGTLKVLSGGDNAKFEIIAVHGLGADPTYTWTTAAKAQEPKAAEHQPAPVPRRFHLLQNLLTPAFPDARILSFAHNSNWLIDAPVKTTEEIGKQLLEEIKDKRSPRHLPIIFIGHSLGGIIIKQALCRSDSQDIVDDTSGIIFLGVPHQGSSVSVAGAALACVTGFLGSDATLLLSLRRHDAQLSNLADTFRSRIAANGCGQRKATIVSFYETKPTYFGWLSVGLVVSRDSAVVHADEDHAVDTNHSGLNKCAGPNDELHAELTRAIQRLRTLSPLEQATKLICDGHYTSDRLKIERLSGRSLRMDQCYINLAIVEQAGQDSRHSKEGNVAPSPFSLLSRQKVETPDKTIQVELPTLFRQREGRNGGTIEPRRILIRGRAGVGKTTLCKKIVHEFAKDTWREWSEWNKLFDRVLWVPLRNLKLPERRQIPGYNFEHLFNHEYFSLPSSRPDLAKALSNALETESGKTLFLLDGLDEVSQDLTGDGSSIPRFLTKLLEQPNVIITSRPNANHPALQNIDVELETIGFYPDQVKEYIKADPKMKPRVDDVQYFLQQHWLIQGLVRIPIQLDALCYTWEDLNPGAMPNSMTGIYIAIVQKLWRKDVLRLDKKIGGPVISARPHEIHRSVEAEIALLECLAFNGLHSDMIGFTQEHRDEVVESFPHKLDLLLDETLGRLSFMRTSDTSSKIEDRNYHFLHLTFQEYFAARYFVQQWTDGKQLKYVFKGEKNTQSYPPTDTAEFLRRHKYSAHYDVFWRFVAGLLAAKGEKNVVGFFTAIEEEPLDLLGPTHQRLVMHCLSEVTQLPIRSRLEAKLTQWLLYECDLTGTSYLARESEFPDRALHSALERASGRERVRILEALRQPGRHLSKETAAALATLLKDKGEDRLVRSEAANTLWFQSSLPEATVAALAALLKDKDEDGLVRSGCAQALGRQSSLPKATLAALAALLKDKDEDGLVRSGCAQALGRQSSLPKATLAALAGLLKDKDEVQRIRARAALALGDQSRLPEVTQATLAALLRDKDEDGLVRSGCAQALGRQSSLPEATVAALAALLRDKDEDGLVRSGAAVALGDQSSLQEATVAALAALLKDKDEDGLVRSGAAEAFGRQSRLPEATVAALAALLKDNDEDWLVRIGAAKALRRQSSLQEATLAALAALLKDKDKDKHIRFHAAQALGCQSSLPEATMATLVALLKDKDEDGHIRSWCAEALDGRSSLPEATVAVLASLLKDEDRYVRSEAARMLGAQSILPEATVATLAALLKDKDGDVCLRAAEALGHQPNLLDKILKAFGLFLESERQAETIDSTIRNPEFVASLYGVLLCRGFHEQSSLYVDDDSCIINQPSGLRTVPFERSRPGQFLDAVRKHRQLWNPRDYNLWDGFERDDAQQGPSTTM